MSASGARKQPEWSAPGGGAVGTAPIMVRNSLCMKEQVPFVPADGRHFLWYGCGPTVYDSAHLGHARNYVTTDYLRRIIEDYFGFETTFVMNITDVDDKIILRARRNYLFDQFRAANEGTVSQKLLDEVTESVAENIASLTKKVAALEKDGQGSDAAADTARKEAKLIEGKLNQLKSESGTVISGYLGKDAGAFLDAYKDSVSIWLDERKGHQFQDNDVIRSHAATFEEEFLQDMKALGVRPADVLTRVSEYIPEVVEYVEKIIANGYGYVAPSGSVYFDTLAFNEKKDHFYAKLEPGKFEMNEQNLKLLAEGEGSLAGDTKGEKRNPQDFALWKSSKPGEPIWKSPWGEGRPGWHIECSAMSSAVLGQSLDIHSGGVDLKFPHHDNEIAQAEAYYDSDCWVHYFLHPGHLHINGLKMSKSLKNFITIREAFQGKGEFPPITPRQMRIMFLLAKWDSVMDFSGSSLEEMKAHEKTLGEFFLTVNNVLREQLSLKKYDQNWRKVDTEFHQKIRSVQLAVDAAFRNSFDTGKAFMALLDLVKATNVYVNDKERRSLLVRKSGAFVLRILRVFGLTEVYGDYNLRLDYDKEGAGGQSKEELLRPHLDALTSFRSNVRDMAKGKQPYKDILEECDKLRDVVMPANGVRILDDAQFPYSLVDPEVLQREMEEKKAAAEKQAKQKKEKRIKALTVDIELWEKRAVEPEAALKALGYTKFDEEGKPTHGAEEKELAKGAKKKADKLWQTATKNYETYSKKLQEDPEFLNKLRAEREELQK